MNIKNIILGLIIAVVFLVFAVFGTNLVYKAPQYNDYCNYNYGPTPVAIDKPMNQTQMDEQQKYYQECQARLDVVNKDYAKNLFIISTVISVLVILVSALLIKVESVSSGLMFGSLMFLIYGTARYFGYMDDWLRFIILGIALIILIYIGYWLANRGSNEKINTKKRLRK